MSDTEINRVLEFWFSDGTPDHPSIDSRMERWFAGGEDLDEEIRAGFGALVEQAIRGALDRWAATPRGRLALILLLDQFTRHVHRGTARAYAGDARALRLCVDGAVHGSYKTLAPLEQAFYFMPLQHAESLRIQDRSVKIFEGLATGASETLRATFATFAQFAELHRDIVAAHGRFPHRNRILGRDNTAAEAEYLDSAGPAFGQ